MQHLRRTSQFIGAEDCEETFDRRPTFRRAQIPARGLMAFGLDRECVVRVVEARTQPSQPFVAHQHQVALLGLMAGRGRIEARWSILDGVEAIGWQGLLDRKLRAREGLWRKPLHRIAVDSFNSCIPLGHRSVVSW
jgi:hypothetical protein